jgi:hypothetical protein
MDLTLTADDEARLRNLANGLAKQIEDPEKLLARLGFSGEDYAELSESRIFKGMLTQALVEWEGAANTHKRTKLKAAVNVEEALPSFYQAMVNVKEPLSSRVKALEIISRIAGLGNPEPVAAGNGQFFKLEINLGAGIKPMVLANGVTIEHGEEVVDIPALTEDRYSQSKLFDALPLEEL